MNEEQLREGLRSEMASITPPPPLSTGAALGAARRTQLRRRAVWASLGSAAVVLAVAGFAAVTTPDGPLLPAGGQRATGISGRVGGHQTGVADRAQDGRAAGGPDRASRVQARPGSSPAQRGCLGHTLRLHHAGGSAEPSAEERTLRTHQAQFEDKVNGVDVWSYSSSVAVAQGNGTGRVIVEVHDAGNPLPTEPCALAQNFWGMQGECQVETVGAVQVGVVVRRPGSDERLDQWSACPAPGWRGGLRGAGCDVSTRVGRR